MIEFKPMSDILEEREGSRFKLEKMIITGKEWRCDIPKGTYMRLRDKENRLYGCVMSDTPMEQRTNTKFIEKANGDILIGGLGIGMVLIPLIEKPEVKSITVIEKYQEIIDIVGSQIDFKGKVTIINDDVFKAKTPRGAKYDIIYFDIWNYINSDIYEEMKQLKAKYKSKLRKKSENPKSWIGCWCEKEAKNNSKI